MKLIFQRRVIGVMLAGIAISLCWYFASLVSRVRSQGQVGTVQKTLQVGSVSRSYLLHVPASYDKNRSAALLIVFHGGESRPPQMERYTGFSDLADHKGFVVAYPEGIDKHWNDGREGAPNSDDVAFVVSLIDDVSKGFNIDRKRIYATGISNGGMFTQRLACELSGKFAAVASVAASMPQNLFLRCKPANILSVLMIHGTDDPLVPYRGGPMPRTKLGGAVLSVPDAIKFWATHNHCSLPSVSTELPDMDAADQTRVRRDDYTRCTDGAEVVLYTVEGGGHTLPGGTQYLPVKLIGQTSHDVDGSEVIWKFFAAHRQP